MTLLITKITLFLASILICSLIAFVCFKKFGSHMSRFNLAKKQNSFLIKKEELALSPQVKLVIVQYHKQRFLVSQSSSHVQLLKELPVEEGMSGHKWSGKKPEDLFA